MTTISAKVIEDSISTKGKRLTTLELYYPRFIHQQLLTHRMFSRSSSSSRAIPIDRVIEEIENNPVIPIEWGLNKAGMQAEGVLSDDRYAKSKWMDACRNAIAIARDLQAVGLHKQIVNRILEPFAHIKTLVTATEWDNFFELRLDKHAQPEIQELARQMKQAMIKSQPVQKNVHTPYLTDVERKDDNTFRMKMISAARCARVSYKTHIGEYPNQGKDYDLAVRLRSSKHFSPFEHVAEAGERDERYRNFVGWKQLRISLD